MPEQAAHPANALRVEAVDRFVEDEHSGVAEQGESETEPLPHAQRVATDPAVAVLGESDLVEHGADTGTLDARGEGVHGQVIRRRATGVEARRFECRVDACERM